MKSETRPIISIVIAAHNGKSQLMECLESLSRQTLNVHINDGEIIVVGDFNDETRESVHVAYPMVKVLSLGFPVSVPTLRSYGIKESKGDIIALLEDHCAPAEDWVEIILAYHKDGHLVVGGSIENVSTRGVTGWAVYFLEYTNFMNPITSGGTTSLPGNNVSYRRSIIDCFENILDENLWEFFWHKKLMQNGIKLVSVPELVVYHNRTFPIVRFWYISLMHGWNYSAARVQDSGVVKLIRIALSGFLPFALTLRVLMKVMKKKRLFKEFFLSLPVLLWFYFGWSLGELFGTIAGEKINETGWGK